MKIIKNPSIVEAAGTKKKIIEEFAGMVNTSEKKLSIAFMRSPEGWEEPGQTPEFDEYTFILKGTMRIETRESSYMATKHELVHSEAGEWIRYSTPEVDTEYISVCIPAFTPATVHRDKE